MLGARLPVTVVALLATAVPQVAIQAIEHRRRQLVDPDAADPRYDQAVDVVAGASAVSSATDPVRRGLSHRSSSSATDDAHLSVLPDADLEQEPRLEVAATFGGRLAGPPVPFTARNARRSRPAHRIRTRRRR